MRYLDALGCISFVIVIVNCFICFLCSDDLQSIMYY